MRTSDADIFPAARTGCIVPLAKRPGLTSFSSLRAVKRALGTNRVGHTGTLDSFASGLLVVCAGPLTRVAARITEFDKTYDAVLSFGAETDTLEYTGKIIRTAPLPSARALIAAVGKFTGRLMQRPPAFSAVHVDGRRASDLARGGSQVELPERAVTVYDAKITEIQTAAGGGVEAARVAFRVSKGTYIRSLARDIGRECGSAAHLAALRRTAVGVFRLEDAAGFCLLGEFSLAGALRRAENRDAARPAGRAASFAAAGGADVLADGAAFAGDGDGISVPSGGAALTAAADGASGPASRTERGNVLADEMRDAAAGRDSPSGDGLLLREIREKVSGMTEALAARCGFSAVHLKKEFAADFYNGRPLRFQMFAEGVPDTEKQYAAVFDGGAFAGLAELTDGGLRYSFVIPAPRRAQGDFA